MAQAVVLTQSRYYSPVLNAAVFDGPVRIYFAQHQEGLALKVYYMLQQYLKEKYATFRKSFKNHGQTVFLMLYPNEQSFETSFGTHPKELVALERLGHDHVLGVCGPKQDDEYTEIFEQVKSILQGLELAPELPAPSI